MYHNEAGSIFFGTADQKNRPHYICQVSGLRANDAWNVYAPLAQGQLVRVTRLDPAVTVDLEGREWSQSHLFARLRRFSPTRSISYIESKSGPQGRKLATVYVGSRSSDRMIRIYEKVLGDDSIALRFEVEYKSARAAEVANLLLRSFRLGNFLRAELDVLNDDPLTKLFCPVLRGAGKRPVVKRTPNKTREWLMEQVRPALMRFLNEHGNEAHELRYAFLKVLLNAGVDVTEIEDVQSS
jgi:DNA relaxase NicK